MARDFEQEAEPKVCRDMTLGDPQQERRWLLQLSAVVTLGTFGIALLIAHLSDIAIAPSLQPSVGAVSMGCVATLPLIGMLAVLLQIRWRPIRRLYEIVIDVLGPALGQCSFAEKAFIAIGAGVSEELLFRGVLQNWLARSGFIVSLVVPNVLFGLLHAVTPTYACLACFIGMYLSCYVALVPDANLLSVMLAHAAYDLVAFLVVGRLYRQTSEKSGTPIAGASELDT